MFIARRERKASTTTRLATIVVDEEKAARGTRSGRVKDSED